MKRILYFLCYSFLFVSFSMSGQDGNGNDDGSPQVQADPFKITKIEVKDSIYMLQGRGGNIGVFIGSDGVLMIDDQFADASPNIMKAVRSLSDKPVQYLMNTHHHGDHTGGNAHMHSAGTTIFSHQNARVHIKSSIEKKLRDSISQLFEGKDLESEGRSAASIAEAIDEQVSQQSKLLKLDEALPSITFNETITFHYNGQDVRAFHVDNAHTDGDAMVYFTKSNVIHTGDAYIKDKYPYIDSKNGGSVEGYYTGLTKLLKFIDDETIIIPGHGGLARKADVESTHSMIKYLKDRVSYYVISGKTLQEIQSLPDVAAIYNEKGFDGGFISGDKFVEALYESSLKKYPSKAAKVKALEKEKREKAERQREGN